ncbi:MAG: hypothetical protein IT440_11945 [Phycisphaeraceae bacterium]|nr:hypothetical protein [Phycisphaeraceae bacterium]
MNAKVGRTLKSILVWVMLIAVVLCTTISVMGIWQVIQQEDVVLRCVATLGVVFFGCVISMLVISIAQKRIGESEDVEDNRKALTGAIPGAIPGAVPGAGAVK